MHRIDIDAHSQRVTGYWGTARVAVGKDQQTTNVLVRVPTEPWKSVLDLPMDKAVNPKTEVTVPNIGKLTLLNPRGDDSSASIDLIAEQPGTGYVKVVDQAGKEHHGLLTNPYSGMVTFKFDIPLKQVSAFRAQARPIDGWVEFRNVSLRDGHKTDVMVVTSDDKDEKPMVELPKVGAR